MPTKEAAAAKKPKTRFERIIEDEPKTTSALVHPDNDGFRERVTPKEVDESKLFLYKCPCGGQHMRHAGYMRVMMPYIESGEGKRMTCENYQVMICLSCKVSTIWVNGQMYDVSDRVDLKAWEKSEKTFQAATGPGGEC